MKSTLLLSIHPRFADGILAGVKRVELHRRLPRIRTDDAVVIYATVPTSAVVGFFTVEGLERLPLGPLWRRVRDVAGVTRAEYLDYFAGLAEGVGIFVGEAERFRRPLPLRARRRFGRASIRPKASATWTPGTWTCCDPSLWNTAGQRNHGEHSAPGLLPDLTGKCLGPVRWGQIVAPRESRSQDASVSPSLWV